VCAGAADNAAGVAAAFAVARAIVADGTPRRSVVIALWDREEDGLEGSLDYVLDPAFPLDKTVAYVNFDIQGANLLPSLANATVMVGAETGGPALVAAALKATEASTLDTAPLSLIFGQGRSDHAEFVKGGVPSVFFTDANNGCYHTAQDDVENLDFAKLDQQILTATALTRDLVATDTAPTFTPNTPPATYDDAVTMLGLVSAAEPDYGKFDAEQQATTIQFLADLNRIVDAGAAAFSDADVGTVLGGSGALVAALASGECASNIP
jgi:Zn-dependent M28 family amino/carboxypeptidase